MKNVVFVIDVSGSMSGIKIQQTREAMETILGQLREGDTFNIVTFESQIHTWQTSQMVPVTPDMIKSAKEFARDLHATGSKKNYAWACVLGFEGVCVGGVCKYLKTRTCV